MSRARQRGDIHSSASEHRAPGEKKHEERAGFREVTMYVQGRKRGRFGKNKCT